MGKELKVISYNIHSGVGLDEKLDLDRIADLIAKEDADLIGLNEVNNCNLRSKGVEQGKYIADSLGYHYIFGKAIDYQDGEYGNAFMSRYPIISSKNHSLPIYGLTTREPRGMLECDVDVEGKIIKIFITHLATNRKERKFSIDYIAHIFQNLTQRSILLGDFNTSYSGEYEDLFPILDNFKDTAVELGIADEMMTAYSTAPFKKIDYIFVSNDIDAISTYTISSPASDHLPVICKIRVF
ncbi:MAG: hypothetical protein GX974_04940 [Clostridiales bacterium]|nr:hypothetical protein [Clostridiales bacterium]